MENETTNSQEAEWDDTAPKDTWRNYSATGRFAIIVAGITFVALFLPFHGKPWGLPVATLAAYSGFVFSMAFRDKNCSLRKPLVQRQIPKFLLLHVPFLILVYMAEAKWINLTQGMPDWLTTPSRRGSLYEWILIVLLGLIAWWEVHWMRAIVKRRFRAQI